MTEKTDCKYAVVDLEATSAGVNASIIQVGIVIIHNGRIIDTYQTDVNPHEPLTDHIKSLTGISDAQLQRAPDFSQVAKSIFDRIKDCVFVAHNVTFDANLLAEALFLEGYELRTPRVDTVELAQIFYPTLEKYTLSHLSQELHLDLADAHTAIADARATAQLFLHVQAKIAKLPYETLSLLVQYADNLLFETATVLTQALPFAQTFDPKHYQLVHGLVLTRESEALPSYQLSNDFAINAALLGLEERAQQIAFAKIVTDEFAKPEASFIEAQAGIGKTYGYLLPLLAKAKQEQVLISVPTKVLQDQIMSKEAAQLAKTFHLSCHSLKGPKNYLKLDSFKASLEQTDTNRLINRYKMQLVIWLLETKTGDLDEIKQKQRYAAYFEQVAHDGNLLASSPFYDVDFWWRSYQKAQKAQLLITNHAYFLHRIEDDKDFARGKILVFDEAQNLMLAMEQLLRQQSDIKGLIDQLDEKLATTEVILQRRLYEGLLFELNHLVTKYHQTRMLEQADFAPLKQLLAEIKAAHLPLLEEWTNLENWEFWLSSDRSSDKRITYLNATSPQLLRFSDFLPQTTKTYFISATLQISQQVSLANLLGYETYHTAYLAKQVLPHQRIFIDQSMPLISKLSDQAYTEAIVNRLERLQDLQVPILVLFNAKKHMYMVSEELEGRDLGHLAQEKHGTAYHIKKRFDKGEQALLLGVGAFWEGVDFTHADRMITVITRLPFDHPNDPFVLKMNAHLLANHKQPFTDYFQPMALLKLKQAIGRTMRRPHQKSAVIILDKRLLTKTYGQEMTANLSEEFMVSSQKITEALPAIQQFLL
ncbi:bifunctional DnaQ family exonuclease/ATP-dependent helicase [Streptococcus halichoeri]|uniref:bifunctional DnaQ family exonuclease/ATP-dependent helicase n=1 Tax=Streptococcus halichoeri TaxID=254785 RepID=UPI001356CB62|nr:bifunctional DnaQ family exonuclease/ATP-dependent helicase [Streptococcus halichoeri]